MAKKSTEEIRSALDAIQNGQIDGRTRQAQAIIKTREALSKAPDEAIKALARCFYPSMVDFFNSEEGQREYEEWLKEQEALQALPVAA